jgi:hypothetical protein
MADEERGQTMEHSTVSSPGDAGVERGINDATSQVPDAVQEAHMELDRLIASLSGEAEDSLRRKSGGDHLGGPRDLYLIISNKRALTQKYGQLGFEQLDSDLGELKRAVEQRAGLECAIMYVDDGPSVARFGLEPVDPRNPRQIKKLVDTVEGEVAKRGGTIRYLLIVGGDGIVPFHRLPNPVDDQDRDVPSDNPYACRDGYYLIPERAVGRLPDGASEGLGFLHSLIRTSAEAHRRRSVSKGLLGALGAPITGLRHALHTLTELRQKGQGLGYTASIWRKASRAVFRTIGDDSQLRTCPPLTYEGFRITERPDFSYFNLHGIEDGPYWYGQRDTLFPADYPLFPLALRPQDLRTDDHAQSVVFTEACYGANILGKNVRDSIALRFLDARALAVVGSTKVSYGSIAPPLLGADLIGKYFWEGLQAHLTAGEALKHAKVNLAREMQQRQGYLDGEDQKALISFVLYGDPSLPIKAVQGTAPVGVMSKGFCPPIICGREPEARSGFVSDELVATVKGRIEMTMPHMSDARVRAKPLPVCDGNCDGPCRPPTALEKRASGSALRHEDGHARTAGWAVTLEKSIPVAGDGTHHQVVKVVVDENGHVLKVVVSK